MIECETWIGIGIVSHAMKTVMTGLIGSRLSGAWTGCNSVGPNSKRRSATMGKNDTMTRSAKATRRNVTKRNAMRSGTSMRSGTMNVMRSATTSGHRRPWQRLHQAL